MIEPGSEAKAASTEAERRLAETLEAIEAVDREASTFRQYMHDNHWADKAQSLWAARYA